jgi:DHA2 family methylenomycin A resistance protein-like MFS transporter
MSLQSEAETSTGPARPTLALGTPALSFFLITLNASMVTTALPTIGLDLAAGAALVWVLTGYSLVFAVFLLPAGSLSDRIGARRAFMLGMATFTGASVVCALAGDIDVLLGARAVQGAAAATILPSGLVLLNAVIPDPLLRAKAVGQWSAAGAVALVVGSPAGGAVTTIFGWQGIFWLNVPVGLLALVAALGVPETGRQSHVLPPRGGGSRLIRQPSVVVSTVSGFAVNFASYGAIFVVTLFLQQLLGRSAWTTGLVFVPMTVLIIPANLLAGRLTSRYGARRIMVLGQLLMTSGLLGLCSADAGVSLWVVIGWLLPIGVGAGLVAPAMTTMMLDGMPAERGGFGAGLLNASRQVGSGASAALFGALLSGVGSFVTGLRASLLLAAIVVILSAILGSRRWA